MRRRRCTRLRDVVEVASSAATRRSPPSTASTSSIDAGEFVALEGPSGSGKTTLLQLLGALDRPTGGQRPLRGPRPREARATASSRTLRLRAFGFVFQQFNLIPTLTALQNVEARLAPTGVGGDELRERALALLGEVGLAERADAPAAPALRRRAAARRDRARARRRAARDPRRRADRQPRLEDGRRRDRPARRPRRAARRDGDRRDPRRDARRRARRAGSRCATAGSSTPPSYACAGAGRFTKTLSSAAAERRPRARP